MLARLFDLRARLFHTVFNRTVENCRAEFIIPSSSGNMTSKLCDGNAQHFYDQEF